LINFKTPLLNEFALEYVLSFLISIEVEHSFVLAKEKSVTKLHQIGFEHKLHLIKKFFSASEVKAYLLNNLAYFEKSFLSPILPKQRNFPPPHVTQETIRWNGKKPFSPLFPLPTQKNTLPIPL